MSLRVNEANLGGEKVEISGRGDLHLGILIEKMRREGFEMSVTPPKVIMKGDPKKPDTYLEPYE